MEIINLGTGVGKGDGDLLRDALEKANNNFAEIDQKKQSKIENDFDLIGNAPSIVVTSTSDETIGYWTLSESSTFSVSIADGRALTMFITKGGNTLNFPNNIKWIGGTAPTLNSLGYNILELFASRGVIYGSYLGNVVP